MTARSPTTSTFALVVITYVLLVFGATVRVQGAGLACPDWPLCFGVLVPAFDVQVYLEFGHRVLAGLVSLWFLANAWWIGRRGLYQRMPLLKALVIGSGAVLAVQIVLGGLTVLELLAEWTVASHLIAGHTFCTLLLLVALAVSEAEGPATRDAVSWLQRLMSLVVLVLVPTQIVLGGLVSGSEAGLVCGTWPSCNGAGWFPTFQGLVGLQVMHRVMAYSVAAVIVVHTAVQWRSVRTRLPAFLLLSLVGLQVGLGILNVLLQLPAELRLMHSGVAAGMLLAVGWTLDEVWRAPLRQPESAPMGAVEAK